MTTLNAQIALTIANPSIENKSLLITLLNPLTNEPIKFEHLYVHEDSIEVYDEENQILVDIIELDNSISY